MQIYLSYPNLIKFSYSDKATVFLTLWTKYILNFKRNFFSNFLVLIFVKPLEKIQWTWTQCYALFQALFQAAKICNL